MHNLDALLTSAETAARLGVTVSTISRWVASGKARPAHKLNGRTGAFLFSPTEVRRLERLNREPQAS